MRILRMQQQVYHGIHQWLSIGHQDKQKNLVVKPSFLYEKSL